MSDGSDRAFLEPQHTVNLGGDVARHVVCEDIGEMRYGVSLHMTRAYGVPYPVFLIMLQIHAVVEVQRGGPGEVFEQLDRQVDRQTVLHAVLHVVEPSAILEEETVWQTDVVLGVDRIAHVQLAVPVFLACFAHVFQRIDAVHRQRDLR